LAIKKAQGAAEYLILLAVVLIVGLVAMTLLGGFSGFGSTSRESEGAQYWKGFARPFSIQEWAQHNSTLTLTIKNMEPDKLIITNITIGNVSYVPSGGISFGGGASKTISISGLPACDANTYDYYDYDVVIIYSSFNIQGKVQKGEKKLSGPCFTS
jgi:hypothetical protein